MSEDSPKYGSENAPKYYQVGEQPHLNEFLRVPGATVTVHQETPCTIEQLLATVGRIAAAQPGCKVSYWIQIK